MMKKLASLFLGIVLCVSGASGQQTYELYENFHIPRFYPEKIFLYNTDSTTLFLRSANSGFEWGGYSPVVSNVWGPIGYLYSDVLDHIRNALCFIEVSESPGSYAYCQFDSPETPGLNDSLAGITVATIKFQDDGPEDKLGLMIRDASGEWFYSDPEHGVYASGSEIRFTEIETFGWMKIEDSISENLNDHAHIEYGLGDITQGAKEGSPDLSYIIGAGIILHEAESSDFGLRIEDIRWEGKLPETSVDPVQPEDNASLSILSTILKWAYKGSDTVRFDVWIALEGNSFTQLADSIATSEFTIDALSDNSSYEWRVDVLFKDGSTEQGNP